MASCLPFQSSLTAFRYDADSVPSLLDPCSTGEATPLNPFWSAVRPVAWLGSCFFHSDTRNVTQNKLPFRSRPFIQDSTSRIAGISARVV